MLCRLLKNALVGIVTAIKANVTVARELKRERQNKVEQSRQVNHAGNVDGD
jgi:hypothetical protein